MKKGFTLAESAAHADMPPFNAKFGFTLAEVLITLGIIGVVSAMTIPTLYGNYRKKQTVAKLQKAYSMLTQVYKVSNDEVGDLLAEEAFAVGAKEYFKRYWTPYIKVGNYCKTYQDCGYSQTHFPGLNGNGGMAIVAGTGITFSTNDGMIIVVRIGSGGGDPTVNNGWVSGSQIIVDINGSALPNVIGKDVFMFTRSMDNYGSSITPQCAKNSDSSINSNCSPAGAGTCCAEKIKRAGWKIDSTYPW